MDAKPEAVHEDFLPDSELVPGQDSDTLLIHLPGFKKEQLRVQLSRGVLRVSGSRPIGNNRWSRFLKEFPVPDYCDSNKITARFEGGILHLNQPRLITPAAEKKDQKLPQPQKPSHEPLTQQKVPERTKQRDDQSKQTGADSNSPDMAQENVEQKPKNDGKNNGSSVDSMNVKESAEGKQASTNKKSSDEQHISKEGKKSSTEARTDPSTIASDDTKDEKMNPAGKVDSAAKTSLASYRHMAGAMRARLKMQRRAMNVILAALAILLLSLYVYNSMRSFRQVEH